MLETGLLMLIQKMLIFILTTQVFSLLQSSHIPLVTEYAQAKKELETACESADLNKITPLAAYFHRTPLVTQKEKEVYTTILNKKESFSKKKMVGLAQVGLSATSFLVSYLCWTSHGNSSLRDSSSSYNPQIEQSLSKASYAYNHNNFGDAKKEVVTCAELYCSKGYDKASYYGQKTSYALGTAGLLSSGMYFGYAGLANLLAPDNRKNIEIKKQCLDIIEKLPCREITRN